MFATFGYGWPCGDHSHSGPYGYGTYAESYNGLIADGNIASVGELNVVFFIGAAPSGTTPNLCLYTKELGGPRDICPNVQIDPPPELAVPLP